MVPSSTSPVKAEIEVLTGIVEVLMSLVDAHANKRPLNIFPMSEGLGTHTKQQHQIRKHSLQCLVRLNVNSPSPPKVDITFKKAWTGKLGHRWTATLNLTLADGCCRLKCSPVDQVTVIWSMHPEPRRLQYGIPS